MSPSDALRGLLLEGGGTNPVRSGVPRPYAMLARLRLIVRGACIGRTARIALSCRVFAAPSVCIGEDTEILRNSTLDGCPRARGSITIGTKCRLKENVWLAAYEGRVEIGHRVLIGRNSVIHGHGGVTIGDDTMLGPGCMLFSSDHIVLPGKVFQESGHINLQTTIGRNVWLGAGVIVTGGSAIGENVVVAAGSVVIGPLEGGRVYGGTPAKVLRDVAEVTPVDPALVRRWGV